MSSFNWDTSDEDSSHHEALCIAKCPRASDHRACFMFAGPAPNSDCDQAKMQHLVDQGYDLLNRGQWFQAHIVGQSLINIGDSCRVLETEVPATIQDLYIRAYVTQATNDLGQEWYFVSKGLAGLGWVKEHAGENPAYAKLYDDMEPRFLELQRRMQWQR